jgi:hypothetical protein
MPHSPGNMLIVRGYKNTVILDPETNETISIRNLAEFTTAGLPLEESNTVIMGQALTGNFGSPEISLSQYNLEDGALLKTWGATAFLPQSLTSRSDAFEFLIRQEFETRRIKITDNSLSSEVIPTPESFYPGATYYDSNENRWILGDSRKPNLVKFSPESKFDRIQSTAVEAPSFFSQIQFLDQSSDGTLQALHSRAAVVVRDPINGNTLLSTNLQTDGVFAFGRTQMVAISPKGEYVAYAYQNDSPESETWHLACQEISTGRTLWALPYTTGTDVVDNLKFSEDGQLLYQAGRFGLYSRFVATGELLRKYELPRYERYQFNKAGTLAVTWRRNSIRIIALPSGETLADLPNDHLYDQLQFIGNDNFLIGSDRNLAGISLFSIKEDKKIAQMYLFEDTKQWLVRDPQTGLFASDQTSQEHLYFVQGKQVSPLAAYFDDFYRPRLLGSLIKGLTLESPIDLADLDRCSQTFRRDCPTH